MRRIETGLENLLWQSRLIVLVAVAFSLLVAVGAVWLATVDAVYLLGHMAGYADPALSADARSTMRLDAISEIVEIVDGYLLAGVMLILALGLYELFVSKIGQAEGSEFAGRLLRIHDIDDLKDRLIKVVLLMLAIKFFQQALRLRYQTAQDLLFLAIGIVLVSGTFWLSHKSSS